MSEADSRRRPWQLSPKVSKLHRSVLESFNEQDRAKFTEILTGYQQNKNIQRLVESLHLICNTPQQREEIYPLMRSFIPFKHRERFDYECSRPKSAHGRHYATYSRKQMPKYGYYTTRSLPGETHNRLSGSSLGSGRRTPTPRNNDPHTTPKPRRDRKESNCRVVVLDREVDGESFGFCIRGGSEYNIGLFVSSVDEGSVAYNAGICLGDQVLEVNRVDFRNISHQQAVEVIQQASILHMLVRSVGKIPGTFKSSSSFRWIDPRGNVVSPPSEYAKENMMNGVKSDMRLLGGDDERKVNLFVADGAEIGLKIRGGMEHGLGIFIASVERNSGADRAGIQVGDQILDVNGKSFLNISHEEAVQVLKSSQQLVIMLKDVGILPHGKRVYDETRWINDPETKHSSRPSSSNSSDRKSKSMKKTPSFHEPMGSSQLTHHSVLDHSDEILEIKAKQVLPNNELQAFAFYLNEYRTTRLSLTSFLTVLSDLLNTPEKGSLFQEIRSAILPRDLTKFDEWNERNEHKQLQAHDADSRQARHDRLSLYSYKSSDSSTNSWLGLFENGDEQRTKTNFKYRNKLDALPHPPKDFFDDSLNSGTTPRGTSYDDFPPPPVFDLNSESTPGSISRFKTNRTFGDTSFAGPHKGPHRASGNVSNVMDKVAMLNGDDTEDGLYTSVNDMDINRKQRDVTSTSMQQNVLSDEDFEDGLYSSVDHKKLNGSPPIPSSFVAPPRQNGGNDPKRLSQANGLVENEQADMSLYATVDKSNIRNRKETKNKFVEENEFEIPPPIPDRLYLETEMAEDSKEDLNANTFPFEQKGKDLANTNFTVKDNSNIMPSETGHTNDRVEIATNAAVETNIASFPERLQKFNEKPSKGGNAQVVQKLKKTKKNKSKGNIVPMEKTVDYSQPFVVELTKHSSNLGLSVAGGTDTDSKEIRIKSIKDEDTVAGSCPLLQPGQIILGVDEKSLQNVTSGIAAMAIRQAFHSDKTVLKLILQNDRS